MLERNCAKRNGIKQGLSVYILCVQIVWFYNKRIVLYGMDSVRNIGETWFSKWYCQGLQSV